MAKVTTNSILDGLSGSLGPDFYVRTTKDGRTIISKKPSFDNRQFSQAQLDQQNRVKQGAAYAKAASKENPIYAKKAAGTAKNAYNVALGDWLNAPDICRIQCSPGLIRVLATDDVMVTGVTVTILDDAGRTLEGGEAESDFGLWWEYRTANSGQIVVEARDLAGNVKQERFRPTSPSCSTWEKPRSRTGPR